MFSARLLLSAVLVATASASLLRVVPGDLEARGVPGSHQYAKRGLVRRASATNAAEMAKVSGMAQECQQYGDQAVTDLVQKKAFPTTGQLATLLPNDKEAKSIWSDIQKSGIVPSDVKVKQQQGSDHMGTSQGNYNVQEDPDCWWTVSQCKEPKHKGFPADLFQCPEPDTWGLTFDDGPNCSHNAFYDYLQKNKLRATLFYIGTNVVNWPYQAQRGITDGHDICVHTWSHHYMTTFNSEQAFAELYYTAKAIKMITGVTPSCWRPPYGDVDDRIRAIAAGLGLRTITWAEDTDDWNMEPAGKQPTASIDANYQKIIDKADSESPIVLTHEINQYTMEEFQKMYPKVEKAYKHVVPLTACQNVTNPYPEDITYSNFADFTSGKIEAKGLPSVNSIKTDPTAKFNAVPLSKMKNGYANPGAGGSSGGSGAKSNNENTSSGGSGQKSGAAGVSATGMGALGMLGGAVAVGLIAM
ncbi:hypothetical protein MSPP1_000001 [Malassezia sp. CBS 17886]|nr:hypothetical protein MSPP1_000001 [Malassezia sp. CBS 17886]